MPLATPLLKYQLEDKGPFQIRFGPCGRLNKPLKISQTYLSCETHPNILRSFFCVTQVEYLVITAAENQKGEKNTYVYNGDLKTIPNPVRISTGYSIIENLDQAGLKVEENSSSLDNFKKLVKEKTGSVIDLEDMTKYLSTQPKFNKQLIISSEPIVSKSYYLGFSKKGKINEEDQNKIWQEIAKVRENPSVMTEFLKKY